MKILINGGGNIGTTIANLMIRFKDLLGISHVYLHKNLPQKWRETDLDFLERSGVIVCEQENISNKEVIKNVQFVFESTANGIGLKNKEKYKSFKNLIGVCAQGSEKGFGIPFMTGINENKIFGEKFVQIVSCNTHAALSLLNTFSRRNFSKVLHSDFVVVRRSEDIGNHERLVTANVVARHLNPDIGTHHAIDVRDLLETIGVRIPISSSDITTPSQLLHSIRFNIKLNEKVSQTSIDDMLRNSHYTSTTNKFDSNHIFELGRRYGFQGRIYSHAIVVNNNIMVHDDTIIKGWAFVPQEGNTLISTIHSFLLQTKNPNSIELLKKISGELLIKKW